jgi:tagatose-6-phosphate ketose/aldose isomerase
MASSLEHLHSGEDVGRADADSAGLDAWLTECGDRSPAVAALLAPTENEQKRLGYYHTLREILQQPATWKGTAAAMIARGPEFECLLNEACVQDRGAAIVLTGSGSSSFAADCLVLPLQMSLAVQVQSFSSGTLLTHLHSAIRPEVPGLVVSFARSGDSPESVGVLDLFLADRPAYRHLIITCCRQGHLAVKYRDESRVTTVVLDDLTCDRSLVMTSSFTNMVLAGRFLGLHGALQTYSTRVEALSGAGRFALATHTQTLASAASLGFRSVVYLASGCRLGAAREAALKMMEMTGGHVRTFAETYLGLRHGPMCAIHDDTLVICFLSSDVITRGYEVDVLRELIRKQLGGGKIVVGEDVPPDVLKDGDIAVEVPGMKSIGDDDLSVLDVLVGQLLAFFRCIRMGLRPDSPSGNNVIGRVVEEFEIRGRLAVLDSSRR